MFLLSFPFFLIADIDTILIQPGGCLIVASVLLGNTQKLPKNLLSDVKQYLSNDREHPPVRVNMQPVLHFI